MGQPLVEERGDDAAGEIDDGVHPDGMEDVSGLDIDDGKQHPQQRRIEKLIEIAVDQPKEQS